MACTSTDNTAAAVVDGNEFEDDDVANVDESMRHMSSMFPSKGGIQWLLSIAPFAFVACAASSTFE